MDFYKSHPLYIVLLCIVYYDIYFVHAQEHAQMLTVYRLLYHLCSLFTSVYCGLIIFYSLTRHNFFTPGPGHIAIQQNCANCLGYAQRQSRIRKYKECSMQ